MRILDMMTFVILARNRHFGRTAEEMNSTQPAISSRLAAMEHEFGCQLVHRGMRDFRLTAEGEKVLQVFQTVLGNIDALKTSLKSPASTSPAVVRIGAIDSVAATWMPDVIDSLHKTLPNLKIELTVEGTKLLVHGMNKGEFDLIFAIDPAIGDGFRSFVSCVWQMIWAGSPKIIDPDRVYSVDDLSRMPLVTFPKDTPPYRQIAPYFQDEQVLASKLTSSNSLFAMISLVIDGFGVAPIPSVIIRRELRMGLLHPIKVSKRFPPMTIIATYQSSTHQDIIRGVVEQARKSAAIFCASVDPATAWTV
ncbi:LysR family transcriptional regulator [Labrys monachus]|uniref:DNA-binding transcriptional LysR family regulator n=1 Tax=Labrys monachus TaxID=217067 RepID=A0ABU0FEI9_9HYPH|nr:LysR family transcriptional regulator [Labrys monachus]MDQ0393026.1 DNA-binding transcriptional LysR family regulator [Labrys monachus]